jgi:hypothetical protein
LLAFQEVCSKDIAGAIAQDKRFKEILHGFLLSPFIQQVFHNKLMTFYQSTIPVFAFAFELLGQKIS